MISHSSCYEKHLIINSIKSSIIFVMFVQLNPLVAKPINMPAVYVFLYGYVCLWHEVAEELIWSKDEG